MPNCEDTWELIKADKWHGGTCYNGPVGLEWVFPTIFAVLMGLFVLTLIIPALAPAMFKRNK